jgi:hypothetical protein
MRFVASSSSVSSWIWKNQEDLVSLEWRDEGMASLVLDLEEEEA